MSMHWTQEELGLVYGISTSLRMLALQAKVGMHLFAT